MAIRKILRLDLIKSVCFNLSALIIISDYDQTDLQQYQLFYSVSRSVHLMCTAKQCYGQGVDANMSGAEDKHYPSTS